METTLVVIASIALGLVIGSFLTVVVDRVPRGASVMAPPSACGSCGHRLTAPDLVPIASYVVLRGRCRHCGARIGIEPLVMELATTTLFVLFGLKFGAEAVLTAFWCLAAALVALVWIDLIEFRLPREITYVAFTISLMIMMNAAVIDREYRNLRNALIGAGIALLIMGVIYVTSRGGMGDGDVRLAPLLGLHLGYLGLAIVPVGLFFGFLIGAVVGLVMMATTKAGRKTALPFGPFLAAGTVVAIFSGEQFVDLIWH
jgi:leader peptidase (prepilin peptidase)/N-methyltransferase